MKENRKEKNFHPLQGNPLDHEGKWEILEIGDEGHPLCWNGHGWQPIRLVVSRWKVSNKPKRAGEDWTEFHGVSGTSRGTQYFRSFCVHRPASRILHQEEMNLHPCRGREGEVLMHDPVLQSTNQNRVVRLNSMLNDPHELPIIHVAMNVDDYGSSARSFDVFIKDNKLDPKNFLARYDLNYGSFGTHMGTPNVRMSSASSAGACEYCANEGEVNMIVIDRQSNFFGGHFGRRGYGWPVPHAAISGSPPTSCFVFDMPSGGRLAIPKRIMEEVMAYRRWSGVKIYPSI